MIYNNVPAREIKQAHGNIRFNTQTEQWECTKCNKTETTQNKRNIMQHAIGKHNQHGKTYTKNIT